MQKYYYYFILVMFQNTLFAQSKVDSLRRFIKLNVELEVIKKYNQLVEEVKYEVPCISPVEAKQNNYITSFFGNRVHPVNRKFDFHSAIDISAKEFENVFATADGMVIEAEFDKYLGNYVIIEHPNGYQTLYGHLSMSDVAVGEILFIGRKLVL